LTNDNALLWYGSISIGTPPLPFTGMVFLVCVQRRSFSNPCSDTVDFDTGSSDLFVPSIDCQKNCEGHARYTPALSVTSQNIGDTFDISFGDGSEVSGEVFTDVVSIAGLTVCRVSLFLSSSADALDYRLIRKH
jgi:cathepsin D